MENRTQVGSTVETSTLAKVYWLGESPVPTS
jgi:hypothetical protein